MADFLLTRPPPEVIGLLLGFCVVGVLATLNQQLGAVGGDSAAPPWGRLQVSLQPALSSSWR